MKRILVAGELNADLVMSGLPSLPIPGRELVGTDFTMAMGSSSAITAARLAALGTDDPDYAVDFIGLVGDDDIGHFVLHQLRGFGVHTDAVQIVDRPTGVTIALTYAHDRAFLTYPGVMIDFDGAVITPELLAKYVHLHVGSFFLQTSLQPQLAHIFGEARAQGVTTSLDVGWDPAETWMSNPYLAPTLAQVDDFLPNEDEAAALAPDTPALRQLVRGTLVIKRGAQGAAAYDESVIENSGLPGQGGRYHRRGRCFQRRLSLRPPGSRRAAGASAALCRRLWRAGGHPVRRRDQRPIGTPDSRSDGRRAKFVIDRQADRLVSPVD